MPVNWPRLVLALSAVGFLGFGLAVALWPLPMAQITDIGLPTSTARIDFRATYGGFQIGVGGFLVACARRPAWVGAGLRAAAYALAGFAGVRVLSLVLEGGRAGAPIYVGLGLEVLGLTLNIWALRELGRGRGLPGS